MIVDVKRIMSAKYRTYRVLRSNEVWSRIYLDRIKTFGNARNVIIFPEAFLGLTSSVYAVTDGSTSMQTSIAITAVRSELIVDREIIDSYEKLIEWQDTCANNDDASHLKVKDHQHNQFSGFSSNVPYFTTREAASTYAAKRLTKLSKSIL